MAQRFIVLLCVCLGMVACAAQQPDVTVDYNQDYDFVRLKTYAFAPAETGAAISLDAQRLEREIESQLLQAGYRKATGKQSDVLVNYLVTSEDKQDIKSYDHAGSFYLGRYGYYDCIGCGHTSIYTQDYTEGTLIIELIDPVAERVVWRAVGKERLDKIKTPDSRDALIRDAVAAMFQQYPPF